jgi:hypothetical protein
MGRSVYVLRQRIGNEGQDGDKSNLPDWLCGWPAEEMGNVKPSDMQAYVL